MPICSTTTDLDSKCRSGRPLYTWPNELQTISRTRSSEMNERQPPAGREDSKSAGGAIADAERSEIPALRAFPSILMFAVVVLVAMTVLNTAAASLVATMPFGRQIAIAAGASLLAVLGSGWLKKNWPLSRFQIAEPVLLAGFVLFSVFLIFAERIPAWIQAATIFALATPLVVGVFVLIGVSLLSEYKLGRAEAKQAAEQGQAKSGDRRTSSAEEESGNSSGVS